MRPGFTECSKLEAILAGIGGNIAYEESTDMKNSSALYQGNNSSCYQHRKQNLGIEKKHFWC